MGKSFLEKQRLPLDMPVHDDLEMWEMSEINKYWKVLEGSVMEY